MCIHKKSAMKVFFNPFSGNMANKPLIITTCCLLFFSCFGKNCSGMFMHLARADVLPTATDNTGVLRGKDHHRVVLKEAGGSLYSISLEAYQKANETLFDLMVQANPSITDIRSIDENQIITIPVITLESYIKKLSDRSYRVHIGTFETYALATAYSEKVTGPQKRFFTEPHSFSSQDTWYRLMIGDFTSMEEALRTVNLLEGIGLIYLSPRDSNCDETIRKTVYNSAGTKEYVFYTAEGEVARQTLDEDENVMRTVGEIPDGINREYYESGRIKAECTYRVNKLEGMSTVYYENGKMSYKCNYADGKKDGLCKSFYDNGNIKYEYEYKKGKFDGSVKKYYKNYKIAAEWDYREGKRQGLTTSYNKNGSLKAEWSYKNDQLDGITRIYYDKGGIEYIDTYKDGYQINRKAYDRRGKFEFEQEYPHDEKREIKNH
jgi:antitoxin component YwqK of YwqJK toxin-antitoxin module